MRVSFLARGLFTDELCLYLLKLGFSRDDPGCKSTAPLTGDGCGLFFRWVHLQLVSIIPHLLQKKPLSMDYLYCAGDINRWKPQIKP